MRINKNTVRWYATEKITITYEAYNLNKQTFLGCSLYPLRITMEIHDAVNITSLFLSYRTLLYSTYRCIHSGGVGWQPIPVGGVKDLYLYV
jgi:hypothetical protein